MKAAIWGFTPPGKSMICSSASAFWPICWSKIWTLPVFRPSSAPQDWGYAAPISQNVPAITRLAIASDRAFCFCYEETKEALRTAGAELVPFSPLTDTQLPENTGGLYLPGGYPELYAKKLAENEPCSVRSDKRWKTACLRSPNAAAFSISANTWKEATVFRTPWQGCCGGRAAKRKNSPGLGMRS